MLLVSLVLVIHSKYVKPVCWGWLLRLLWHILAWSENMVSYRKRLWVLLVLGRVVVSLSFSWLSILKITEEVSYRLLLSLRIVLTELSPWAVGLLLYDFPLEFLSPRGWLLAVEHLFFQSSLSILIIPNYHPLILSVSLIKTSFVISGWRCSWHLKCWNNGSLSI